MNYTRHDRGVPLARYINLVLDQPRQLFSMEYAEVRIGIPLLL